MIILNYKERYNELIKCGFEKYPNKRDMLILVYWWLAEGKSVQTIKDMLFDFCKKWCTNMRDIVCDNLISEVMEEAQKPQKELQDNIKFTKLELDGICGLDDFNCQKVLFILTSVAKIKQSNYLYLNTSSSLKLNDIFSLAKVRASRLAQNEILHKLYNSGAINILLKPLLKCEIINMSQNADNSDSEMSFEPNKDMILYFLKYCGKAIACANCGKLTIKTNNKTKYCKECKIIKQREQQAEYMRKKRNVEK